ncbi:MAG TPA: SDR family NAD(P)-dependent oxidoreductase [Burkholderiales bacterium]|nr:SDR family NAD(P)-dependent oxidoreductase [Burkholderiales bacterium]
MRFASLRGRTAVVTGAAGTMGRAVALALRTDGLRVVGLDVRPAKGCVVCDISEPDAVAHTMRRIGRVDVLVNNAGILSNNKSEATTPEEWHRVLAANLDGAFYLSRAVIPGMKQRRWGRIVNTCSLAAKTGGLTAGTAYSTSKGALTSLTFSLARELAGFGVTVNGISPAYVNTPMVTEQLSAAQRKAVLAQIPVGRFCEPEEFAHVVRFLVHPLAGFITGEIVDLNGGVIMD